MPRRRFRVCGENPNCIDSTGALELETLPQSMVVIGGGVIGLELACAYAAFGTKITVVEALDHILPMLDGEVDPPCHAAAAAAGYRPAAAMPGAGSGGLPGGGQSGLSGQNGCPSGL